MVTNLHYKYEEDCVNRKRVKYLIHTLHIPKEYEQPLWNGLDDLPSVFPKQRIGKWKVIEVLHGEWEGTKKYACNKCGEKVGVFKSNYCPNCGAKMEGEE